MNCKKTGSTPTFQFDQITITLTFFKKFNHLYREFLFSMKYINLNEKFKKSQLRNKIK